MSLTLAINKEYSSKEQILEDISSQEEFGFIQQEELDLI